MVHPHVRTRIPIRILSSRNFHLVSIIRVPLHSGIPPDTLPIFALLLSYLIINPGFTIVNTYVAGSAYSSALFSFMILVFTIQYYFIIRSFWIGIGLGNDGYNRSLGNGEFQMLRILSGDSRQNSSYNTNVGMT